MANSSRERHIRQIVESANKDKSAQMKVRRTVGASDKPASKSSSAAKTSRREPVQSRREAPKRAVEPREVVNEPKRVVRPVVESTKAVPKPTAKPVTKSKSTKNQENEEGAQNARVWIGIVLIFVAGLLLLSCLSYLKYWKQDADLAQWSELLRVSGGSAKNWCGRLGAILGELFIGRWFGVFGILSAVWVLFLAVKIFAIRGLKLRRSLRATLVVMFLGSVVLGHFMGVDTEIFGSGLGGAMGISVAVWLDSVIGNEGTSLLLIVASACAFYYVNSGWCVRWYRKIQGAIDKYNEYKRLRAEAIRLRNEKLAQENAEKRAELVRIAAELAAARGDVLPSTGVANVSANIANRGVENGSAERIDEKTVTEAAVGAMSDADESPFKDDVNPEAFTTPQVAEVASNEDITPDIQTDNAQAEPIAKPIRALSETVALDNGQTASVLGYNEDGSFNYLYLDYDALATVVQPCFTAAKGADLNIEEDDGFDDMYSVCEDAKTETEAENVQPIESMTSDELFDEPVNIERGGGANKVDFKKTPVKVIKGSDQEPALVVEYMQGEDEVDDSTINQMELYDPTLELRNYKKPPVELLRDHRNEVVVTDEELRENKERILYTLGTFGIKIDTIEASVGPTVTLYEIVPAPGVRISKIKNLEDDIALSLAALGIRIIAPIPGKGTIGIEVPNKDKEIVSMYSVIKSAKFQESKADLPVAIGKTIQNETFVFDLAKMPHLLVAGATGQGKSVGLNAIITSLLYKKHPSELKFILVDPKKVELTLYSKLEKHFLAKIPDADEAIITDTQKVIYTLNSICIEMDARYDLLKDAGVRGIKEYNDKFIRRRLNPLKGHRFLPYFVVIIDEFADLIMTAGREVETPIARIAQLARAVGIHLIIATQRPTTNIITGVIKANFPARIAFRVTSQIDSRTILDHTGANQLIGRGDMLISTGNDITRVQCAFVDTPEVEMIAEHIGNQHGYPGAYELPDYQPEGQDGGSKRDDDGKRDPLFSEVARYVVDNQSGSASTIQRKFSIGFNRAGRIIDQLEVAGIVGRQEGSKPRQVLIQDPVTLEHIIER